MREIKFRAWDKESKKIVEVISVDFEKNIINVFDEGDYYFLNLTKDKPSGILIQFTGLKDKNGKEIFEGDVLKGEDWVGNVLYKAPFFLVHRINANGEVEEDFILGDYEGEVIGNIYENPELLEVQEG